MALWVGGVGDRDGLLFALALLEIKGLGGARETSNNSPADPIYKFTSIFPLTNYFLLQKVNNNEMFMKVFITF